MLSLASKLLNLAVSSQDCTRKTISEGLNFLGEGPQTPPPPPPPPPPPRCDTLRTLAPLLSCRAARAIVQPRFHCSKHCPPDQTKIASYRPECQVLFARDCYWLLYPPTGLLLKTVENQLRHLQSQNRVQTDRLLEELANLNNTSMDGMILAYNGTSNKKHLKCNRM